MQVIGEQDERVDLERRDSPARVDRPGAPLQRAGEVVAEESRPPIGDEREEKRAAGAKGAAIARHGRYNYRNDSPGSRDSPQEYLRTLHGYMALLTGRGSLTRNIQMESPVYPPELVRLVKDFWAAHEASRNLPPLPADNLLASLLNVAFHAGLTVEEARPVRVCLALFPNSSGDGGQSIPSLVRFASAVPLTVQSVRRLAVAADHRTTLLAVSERAVDGASQLAIWALIYVGDSWSRMREGSQDSSEGGPPACLLVTSTDPGSV